VGSNRRHGESVARSKANSRSAVAALRPVSLGVDQLGDEPVVRARGPVPVSAWVTLGTTLVKVEGFAVAWTSRAVEVQWPTDADTRSAWVWASACERLA
jgi:hypothetical protein